MQTIDYGAAFGFFFKDKAWFRKLAIGSLLVVTLVGGVPVLGWCLEVTRRVGRGEEGGLPEWTGFRSLWLRGYQLAVLNLTWLLPAIVATLSIYLPAFFVHSLNTVQLLVFWFALLACVLIFVTVYTALAIFLLPAAMGVLAETGDLKRALNPAHAWRGARSHFIPHLVVFLIVGLGATTVISVAAPLTLFLALPPLLVYTGLLLAHFAGQLHRLEV
jgi:hypothetical protein